MVHEVKSGYIADDGGADPILDDIKMGILVIHGSVVTSANQKACDLFMLPKAALVGMRLRDFMNSDFFHLFKHYYLRAESTGTPVEFEDDLPGIKLRCHLYPGEKRMVVVFEDITRDRALDEAIASALVTFNSLSEAIFLARSDGHIFFTNDSAGDGTGYSREELRGMSVREVIPDFNLEIFKGIHDPPKSPVIFDATMRSKGGDVVPVEVCVSRQRFMGVTQYVVSARDITRRRRAEEALRESEWKFRAIFDQTFQFIGLLATDGTLLEVNKSALDFIGAEEREVGGKPFWQTPWWTHSGELQEQLRRAVGKAAEGELVRYETNHRAADGSVHYVDFSIKPIKNDTGRVVRLIVEGRDITARKRAERELEEAKAQAELYLDLMGHDINNLNQIGMGFLELALGTLELDESGRSLLSKPLNAFENSSRLIDNVRKLQRAKSGETTDKEMDIGQVLTDVIYNTKKHSGVVINYIPVVGHVVHANELLYDVFSNLVGNAIKHSAGPPLIGVLLEKVCEEGRYYCKVSVEDHGPGIPDDFKKVIFNRHLKGGQKAKGSGIGLYLVKTLVDDYGGRIWVEDRVPGDRSEGSRFVVMLPTVDT